MTKWLWILGCTLLLVACATRSGIERKSSEDAPSTVTASPLPCFFFKW